MHENLWDSSSIVTKINCKNSIRESSGKKTEDLQHKTNIFGKIKLFVHNTRSRSSMYVNNSVSIPKKHYKWDTKFRKLQIDCDN